MHCSCGLQLLHSSHAVHNRAPSGVVVCICAPSSMPSRERYGDSCVLVGNVWISTRTIYRGAGSNARQLGHDSDVPIRRDIFTELTRGFRVEREKSARRR